MDKLPQMWYVINNNEIDIIKLCIFYPVNSSQ